MKDKKATNKAGSTDVDLEYDATTFVGKFNAKAFRKYENRFEELKGVKFDPSYVRHISQNYGGIPKKQWFKTRKGTTLRLGRFLNYLDRQSVEPPLRKSWKGHGDDIRLDWSVDYIIDPLDYFPPNFHPFASLYMGPHHPDEMAEFDLLCFDYSERGVPKIVVWYNDESKFSDEPVTEKVADNFDEFLSMLYEYKETKTPKKK